MGYLCCSESCGLSVAIALADMHECGAGRVVKKAKTQCGAKTRKEPSKNGDEMRFQGQPRSAFRLFMEEFVKKCKDGNAIDVDRGGFETWRCMSKKERQPYELQARKICSDYWQCLIMEENNMPLVDDEADSAEVGKYDKNYKDYMCSDDYDDSGEFLNFYSDESEGLNSHEIEERVVVSLRNLIIECGFILLFTLHGHLEWQIYEFEQSLSSGNYGMGKSFWLCFLEETERKMEKRRNVLMQKYEVGRVLGQGNFAKVYHGRDIKSGQSVAIKVINKEKVMITDMVNQTKREISVMGLIKHPNIVQLYEVMATKSKIFLVLEFVKGGELFNKVAKGRLRENVARKYFQQLIDAVDLCHSRGVYHRDLKLENLLLDEDGNLKVSDFGLSALAESKQQDDLLHTTCGTPAYVAPEVICRKGYNGEKADIWSCGVILFILLAGHLPFHSSNLMEMYRKIMKAEYRCPSWFPQEVRKLLSRILDPNPHTRISIAKIKQHSWFKRGFESRNEKHTPGEFQATLPIPNPNPNPVVLDHTPEEKQEMEKQPPTYLNAFDIISLSTGFDLSGLFVSLDQKEEVQFTSVQPRSAITGKFDEIARNLKLEVTIEGETRMVLKGSHEGGGNIIGFGALSIDVAVYEITSSFHLIEMKRSSGNVIEYQNMLRQQIRPALEEIVWSWQGEQNNRSEITL
nr:CBL-interacting protein kinase 18-like [Ipomoea batatas]